MDMHENDHELIKQLQRGSTQAFDSIYYKYYSSVLANIHRLVKAREDAEEILQDVFASLWGKRDSLDPNMPIAGWLMVVSQNKALNLLRKKVRDKLLFIGEPADDIAFNDENVDTITEIQLSHLANAINNLPPKQKQAFTLCKLQLKTYAQAAELLGISPHTIREYVAKAADKIKWEMIEANPTLLLAALLLFSPFPA